MDQLNAELHGPKAGRLGPTPGTVVLVGVFLAAFILYFFVNWKICPSSGRSAEAEAPRAGWIPLAALGLILLITAGWWALALWPIAVHPGWLARTREVCFGTGLDGLP